LELFPVLGVVCNRDHMFLDVKFCKTLRARLQTTAQHRGIWAQHLGIWTAICTYLLIAILKKELKIDHSLYIILQVLSVNIFERTQVNQLFTNFYCKNYEDDERQPLLL
jgi:hypothetical protein